MPNFSDRWETDEDGNKFVFMVEVQRRLSEAGLPLEPAYMEQVQSAPVQTQPAAAEPSASGSSSASPPQAANEYRSAPPREREREEVTEPNSIQIDPMTGKYVGRVKWYNARKGYGFLLRGAGEEIFFHRSNALGDADELKDGQWILYDVEETQKGPEATDIEPYDNPQE